MIERVLGALALMIAGVAVAATGTGPGALSAAPAGAAAKGSSAALPASPTPLISYLDSLKSLRATFQQTLVDTHGKQTDRSSGTLLVVKPGKLRWEIHPAGTGSPPAGGSQPAGAAPAAQAPGSQSSTEGQLMVADGRNLWFYDRDLQQVTVKPIDAALSATPAMLLSGTVDVQKNFTLTAAGKREGLDWTLVEPHGNEADFRRALFGFDQGELKRIILEDKLGQSATVIFDKVERNGPVSPDEVTFKPPAGVDVIGKPR
jgi:outer membrane lipoprotein carrier protein